MYDHLVVETANLKKNYMLGIAPVDALRDVSLRIEKGDFALVVSVVFALYPAWRASKLKPVNALRYK